MSKESYLFQKLISTMKILTESVYKQSMLLRDAMWQTVKSESKFIETNHIDLKQPL